MSEPRVDHVVMGVRDLDEAAHQLGERFGLAAVGGGRHRGWGTANRVVPLGEAYLELVAVVDPVEAAASLFGRWVGAMALSGAGWGWVVRTDDLEGIASAHDWEVAKGARTGSDGRVVTWRLAGVEAAASAGYLPFFIQWGEGTSHPGATPVAHPAGPTRLVGLTVAGDPGRLRVWLGADLPSVEAAPGHDGVVEIRTERASGPAVIRPSDLA